MASGIFRLTAAVCRTMIIANTGGALSLLLVFLLGGFIRPKSQSNNKKNMINLSIFFARFITDKALVFA